MKRLSSVFALLLALASPAFAGSGSLNYAPSGSAGLRTTTDGTTNCVGSTACNLNNVTIWDSAAGANGLTINASGQITISNTSFIATQATAANLNATVVQSTAANLNATVVGTGIFAVQSTLQSTPTTAIGKVDPNTIATWGLSVPVSGTLPTNISVIGGNDGTNTRVLLMSNTGQPHIICDSGCAGSGGTSSSFGAAFPASGTAAGAEYLSSPPTLTTGQMVALQTDVNGQLKVTATGVAQGATFSTQTGSIIMGVQQSPSGLAANAIEALSVDTNGNLKVNVAAGSSGNAAAGATGSAPPASAGYTGVNVGGTLRGWTASNPSGSVYAGQMDLVALAGTTLAAPTGYGTAPTGNVIGVNAFVTNGTSPGQALMSASSPVVLASDQLGPCVSKITISQTGSTDLLTPTNKVKICSIVLISATAQSIALIEGTGSNCGTGSATLIGSTGVAITTPTMALAANGGFSAVAPLPWLSTATTADHLCLLQSGSGNVSGVITYLDHT
jgi:hypothetical protein